MPRRKKRLSAQEIADDIADRIASGEFPPGSRLPTGHELAIFYGRGRSTISTAMTLLRDRGVVESTQGLGVFVVDPEEDE